MFFADVDVDVSSDTVITTSRASVFKPGASFIMVAVTTKGTKVAHNSLEASDL